MASYLWTKLIKKELIKDENNLLKLRFQEDYAVAEDIIFLAELYLKSQYIQYIDIPLYYYYQREGSVSHGDINDTEWKRDMMKWADSYEWIISRYQQEGINKETIDIIKECMYTDVAGYWN